MDKSSVATGQNAYANHQTEIYVDNDDYYQSGFAAAEAEGKNSTALS